ncbi:MAG: hypothetical protein WDW38_004087 [Sanguina aurantia]
MLCNGAARLNTSHPPFWDALASALLSGGMTGVSLAMCGSIAAAFASTGASSKHVADIFLHIAERVVGDTQCVAKTPSSCVTLLSAFGKARYHHAPLFDKLLSLMDVSYSKFDVTSVLLACARVGHDRREVDALLHRLAVSRVWQPPFPSEINEWSASNMLWSLTVLGMLSEHPLLVRKLKRFKHITSPKQLHPLAAMQLTQVRATLTRLNISTYGLPTRKLLADAVAAGSKRDSEFLRFDGSNLQTKVFQSLQKMIGSHGIVAVEGEAKLARRLLSVDVLVTLESGRRVGVEVDGSSHFLLSDSSKVDGSTRLRNDMLAYLLLDM